MSQTVTTQHPGEAATSCFSQAIQELRITLDEIEYRCVDDPLLQALIIGDLRRQTHHLKQLGTLFTAEFDSEWASYGESGSPLPALEHSLLRRELTPAGSGRLLRHGRTLSVPALTHH